MGKRLADPVPGCEVSRIWDVLLPDMDDDASRIEKAPRGARQRRAFEGGFCSRSLGIANITTLLSGRAAEPSCLHPGCG